MILLIFLISPQIDFWVDENAVLVESGVVAYSWLLPFEAGNNLDISYDVVDGAALLRRFLNNLLEIPD